MMSKIIVSIAKTTLAMFSPSETRTLPLANENIPPMRSKIMLKMDQPYVDFLFQFQYTAGVYLKKLIISFA